MRLFSTSSFTFDHVCVNLSVYPPFAGLMFLMRNVSVYRKQFKIIHRGSELVRLCGRMVKALARTARSLLVVVEGAGSNLVGV